ncbi:MAG: 3D domain-containing protein [Bacilli bacterium]
MNNYVLRLLINVVKVLFVSLASLVINSNTTKIILDVSSLKFTRELYNVNYEEKYGFKSKVIYQPIFSNKILTIEEINELVNNDQKENAILSFTGILTGYGPDCEGCGGKVGCPPRPNVKNGNIYFNDKIYGKVRIVASDPGIPCGSIVKISNFRFSKEPIIAVVLDRGRAVKGEKMDLLYEAEKDSIRIGRQKNVRFDIMRWGWN